MEFSLWPSSCILLLSPFSYSQKETIAWSWELLTERLHIPKDRMYVTYFGGNEEKGIPADLEARDIWISLG